MVDITSAARTQVLDREAIDSIPTGRSIQGMAQLVPGVSLNLPDTGGARAMQQTYMTVRGMTTANTTMLVDGMLVNGLQADGAVQSYFNDAMNQEVSIQTSGISADTSAGGVRMNMIPRDGGNRFSGDFKVAYRPGDWQSDNLTQRHIDRGLTNGNAIDRIVDTTLALGGPIMRDRLWFFAAGRYFSVNNYIANTVTDDGSRGLDDQFIKSGMARLTWQISPSSKLSGYFDEIDKYRGHDMQSNEDPEEAALQWFSPAYHTAAVKYTSTLTNALLLEAGYSRNLEYLHQQLPGRRRPGAWHRRVVRRRVASRERPERPHDVAATSENTQSPERHFVQAAMSYMWRSHNFKGGVQLTFGDFWHTVDANADLTQQYRSNATGVRFSVPDSVVIRNTPLKYGERLNRDVGIYLQDSWRLNRLTINAGLRWEAIKAQVLASTSPAGRFVPEREFEPIQNLPDWQDWAPRLAAVLDVFGNGKTALKYLPQPLQPDPHHRHRHQLQPAAVADDDAALARRQRQRRRRGRARLHRLSAGRLRDRLLDAVAELRRRRAQRVRRLSAHLEPRERARAAAGTDARPVGVGVGLPRQLPQPDHHHQPELDARRLHAVHVLRPEHRAAVRRVRAQHRRLAAPDPQPRHLRPGPPSPVPRRSSPTSPGGFPAAARCSAASRWNGSGRRPAPRPTIPTTCR